MNPALTEQELLELQRNAALGSLLASVAHGVSTPASSLASNTETEIRLLERIEQALAAQAYGRAGELLATCRGLLYVDRLACERITALVKSLKVTARAAGAEFQRASLNQILEAALLLAGAEFRDRIEIRTEFAELPDIECEPHLLSLVFLNLLANAGQAIDGKGVVTLGTRLENGQVHVWVSDTGRGIREEDQPNVLRRGFTTKPLGVGTGLGLLIVNEIVTRRHGGTVDFESQPGQGTTFHVRLPVTRKTVGRASACPEGA